MKPGAEQATSTVGQQLAVMSGAGFTGQLLRVEDETTADRWDLVLKRQSAWHQCRVDTTSTRQWCRPTCQQAAGLGSDQLRTCTGRASGHLVVTKDGEERKWKEDERGVHTSWEM